MVLLANIAIFDCYGVQKPGSIMNGNAQEPQEIKHFGEDHLLSWPLWDPACIWSIFTDVLTAYATLRSAYRVVHNIHFPFKSCFWVHFHKHFKAVPLWTASFAAHMYMHARKCRALEMVSVAPQQPLWWGLQDINSWNAFTKTHPYSGRGHASPPFMPDTLIQDPVGLICPF